MKTFHALGIGIAAFLVLAQAQEEGGVETPTSAVDSQSATSEGGVPRNESSSTEDSSHDRISDVEGKLAGMEESYLETKSNVDRLKKIKISGYVQAQYRMAMDTTGWLDSTGRSRYPIGNTSGGTFADAAWMQLQVRRGRVKVAYETELTQAVIQFDAIPRAVTIKDAYLQFKDPWLKSIGIKAGVFDRPFGYEIGYSSSSRESPERSRLFQTLFPGERDLGVALEYHAADALPSVAHLINAKGGFFTGNGIADENDAHKDIIGRLGFSLPITSLNLAIDGGFSGYMGRVTNTDTTYGAKSIAKIDSSSFVIKSSNDSIGYRIVKRYDTTFTSAVNQRGYSFEMVDGSMVRSAPGQFGKEFERFYVGGDLQVYLDIPVLGGLTLRGEYITGIQPGTASSSSFYNPGRNSAQPVYLREFAGFYGMYVQNINPLNSQLVLKYDVYDPNIAITGDNVNLDALTASINNRGGLSATDLAFTTLGIGAVYHWNENIKFVLYYDRITNETINKDISGGLDVSYSPQGWDAKKKDDLKRLVRTSLPYTEDLNDDVLTFRIQYRF